MFFRGNDTVFGRVKGIATFTVVPLVVPLYPVPTSVDEFTLL